MNSIIYIIASIVQKWIHPYRSAIMCSRVVNTKFSTFVSLFLFLLYLFIIIMIIFTYTYVTQYAQLMVVSEERRKRPCFCKVPDLSSITGYNITFDTACQRRYNNAARRFNWNDNFHILILWTGHCECDGYRLLCMCKIIMEAFYVIAIRIYIMRIL